MPFQNTTNQQAMVPPMFSLQKLEHEDALDKPLTVEDIESLNFHSEQVRGENKQQGAHRIFQENAVAAAQTIVNLALFSKQEKVRLQAAQYVTDRAIGRIQDNPPAPAADPFTSFLEKMHSAKENNE